MIAAATWATVVRGSAIALGVAILVAITALAIARHRSPRPSSAVTVVLFLASYYLLVGGAVGEVVTRYGSTSFSWRTPVILGGFLLGFSSLFLAAVEGRHGKHERRRR